MAIQLWSCSTNHGNKEITEYENETPTISGTVSSGSPVVGTVYLKNATTGESIPATIDENGHYSITLIDYMTGPYILQAKGTVGGRSICMHSLGTRADVSATVNITPMTQLVTGNVLKCDPEQFFKSFDDSELTKAATEENISKHEKSVKQRFKNVFSMFGIDTEKINVMNTSFETNHTGIDGVLDMIRFHSVLDNDGNRLPQMVARLVFSDAQIADDFTRDDDVSEIPAQQGTVTDIPSIANVFNTWKLLFTEEAESKSRTNKRAAVKKLPSSTDSELVTLFSDDFLQNGRDRSEFLDKICSFDDAPVTGSLKEMNIVGLSYDHVDFINGEAQVSFTVTNNKGYNEDQYHWNMVKSGDQWLIKGNQQLVDCYVGAYSAYSKTAQAIIANGLCVYAWTPFADRSSAIHHIGVSGYGIPSGYSLDRTEKGGGVLFVAASSDPKGYIGTPDIQTVKDNEEYVFTLYGADGIPLSGGIYKRTLKKSGTSMSDLLSTKMSYFCELKSPLQTRMDNFNNGQDSLDCVWGNPSEQIMRELNCYYVHSGNSAIKRKIYLVKDSGVTNDTFMIYEKNITRLDIYTRSSDIYDRIFDTFVSNSQYIDGTKAKDIIFYMYEGEKPFRIF